MRIIGLDDILKWVSFNNAPYWKLYSDSKGGNMLAESGDEDALTITASRSRLEDALNYYTKAGGTFYLAAKTTPGKTKGSGFYETKFELPQGGHSAVGSAPGGPPSSVNVQELISSGVAAAMEKFKAELELKQLKDEVEKLRK